MTRDAQGAYHWTSAVDRGYERKAFRIAFGVTGGICLFYIVMSLFMDAEVLGVTLLTSAAALIVVGGVCWLFSRGGNWRQGYTMTEECISFHQRRYAAPFRFASVKKAVIFDARYMIELYQAVGSGPVFVPPEDYEFVKDFILRRLPAAAQIERR